MHRGQTTAELESEQVQRRLRQIRPPYFVKVDDGFNSLGLSNNCVAHSLKELQQVSADLLREYGPVLIQRFVGGRGISHNLPPSLK